MKVTENPLQIELELGNTKAIGEERYEVSMLIKIPLDNVVLLPGAQQHQGKVRVIYAVADAIGHSSDIHNGALPLTIPNQRMAAAKGQMAGFNARLLMNNKTSRVAVAVYDEVALTTATAAVEFSLTDGGS